MFGAGWTKQDWKDTFFSVDGIVKTSLTEDQEHDLWLRKVIKDCDLEFGPHTDHGDCKRMLAEMGVE